MPASMNLRVVIACVAFETVKIVKPALYYKADKVYLLHQAEKAPYDKFLNEVETQLKDARIETESIRLDINKFQVVLREVLRLIQAEKAAGNHVYINIGAGPTIYCAAALIAGMMEGVEAFNVGVSKFQVDFEKYFVDGKPIGLAKEVYDPTPLPKFEIKPPKAELVQGLKVYDKMLSEKAIMSTPNVVRRMEKEGLMAKVCDDKERVTQSAVMRFRRNFLEPWLRNGWVQRDGRKYCLTTTGKGSLEMLG
jgi:hypothetical protein